MSILHDYYSDFVEVVLPQIVNLEVWVFDKKFLFFDARFLTYLFDLLLLPNLENFL